MKSLFLALLAVIWIGTFSLLSLWYGNLIYKGFGNWVELGIAAGMLFEVVAIFKTGEFLSWCLKATQRLEQGFFNEKTDLNTVIVFILAFVISTTLCSLSYRLTEDFYLAVVAWFVSISLIMLIWASSESPKKER